LIPVQQQPEPPDFQEKVAAPGAAFLAQNAKPPSWENREYWRRALDDLYQSYHKICAYTALWHYRDSATVDHFEARNVVPSRAYDWTNFRLATRAANTNKGTKPNVLDPHTIKPDTFKIIFPTCLVKPTTENPLAKETVCNLRLNKEPILSMRRTWLADYAEKKFTFDFLLEKAPFIAYELERQDLKTRIFEMWQMPKSKRSNGD
jgi:hypothetical protein